MFDARQTGENNSPQRCNLSCIALYGGGRWSRVLLPVLRTLLPDDCEIVWITQYGYDRAVAWLTAKAIEGLTLQHRSQAVAPRVDAAIVATTPSTHAAHVRELVSKRIPTFCEKPLTLDYQQAINLIELAQTHSVPLGVNLELHYASYFDQFVELIDPQPINSMNLVWLDPWTEPRYGETKHGDFYTDIVHDMWPHCWSMLRRLMRAPAALQFGEVQYDPIDGVKINVSGSEWTAHIRLGRRNHTRTRRLELNEGAAVLDFSQEPGWSAINGISIQNQWVGPRPLTRSLQSFLDVVTHPELLAEWPLQASTCLEAVRLADEITHKLGAIYAGQISLLRGAGIELSNPASRNLIIDAYLPRIADQGLRWPVLTEAEQTDFVKHICAAQQIRCY